MTPSLPYRVWVLGAVLSVLPRVATATPSTQVWIPSTDIQKFASVHLNDDVYARPGKATMLMLGPTIGVLPFKKIQAEVGFDLMFQSNMDYDKYPFYGHAKLAMPEDAMFGWSPAVAIGVCNVGTKQKLTGQDVGYGLIARTIPYVGRLSAGYFYGNPDVLVDQHGRAANHGVLASWDRAVSEFTDKLWLAVDYQGSNSVMGAVNFGVSWLFTPNISVIVGYDHFLNQKVSGKDTFTIQIDINLPGLAPSSDEPKPVSAEAT